MNAPQVTIVGLMVATAVLNLAKHGEPRTNPFSFPLSLVNVAIWATVLWWGGFWG